MFYRAYFTIRHEKIITYNKLNTTQLDFFPLITEEKLLAQKYFYFFISISDIILYILKVSGPKSIPIIIIYGIIGIDFFSNIFLERN